MNKILVISYLNATSGQFLEYFLMKHDSVFNKGSVRITQFNGYDNWYPQAHKDTMTSGEVGRHNAPETGTSLDVLIDNIKFLKENDEDYPLRKPQMPNTRHATETDIIVITYHELTEKFNLENKDVVIIGIDINNDESLEYVGKMQLLKHCSFWQSSSETYYGYPLTKCDYDIKWRNWYMDCIKQQNVPYYFINHKKFFLESDINEYQNICRFLNIKPNNELYLKNIDYYMYENNRLLSKYDI